MSNIDLTSISQPASEVFVHLVNAIEIVSMGHLRRAKTIDSSFHNLSTRGHRSLHDRSNAARLSGQDRLEKTLQRCDNRRHLCTFIGSYGRHDNLYYRPDLLRRFIPDDIRDRHIPVCDRRDDLYDVLVSNHAKDLSDVLISKAGHALEARARFGLGAIAFQVVGSESLETMVFTLAIVFATSGQGIIIGGAIGFVASIAIASWIYQLGRRVNRESVQVSWNRLDSIRRRTACGCRTEHEEPELASGTVKASLEQLFLTLAAEHLWRHTAHLPRLCRPSHRATGIGVRALSGDHRLLLCHTHEESETIS